MEGVWNTSTCGACPHGQNWEGHIKCEISYVAAGWKMGGSWWRNWWPPSHLEDSDEGSEEHGERTPGRTIGTTVGTTIWSAAIYLNSDISQTCTKYRHYYDSVYNVLHIYLHIILHDHSYTFLYITVCNHITSAHVYTLCLQLIMPKTSMYFIIFYVYIIIIYIRMYIYKCQQYNISILYHAAKDVHGYNLRTVTILYSRTAVNEMEVEQKKWWKLRI